MSLQNEIQPRPTYNILVHPAKMAVMRVVVGSTNPMKVEAVRKAFEEVLVSRTEGDVQLIISSFSVPSGMLF